MDIFESELDYEYYQPSYNMGWKYSLGKTGPHIPNKDEAKLLRRIMSETNMSEDEVRGIKKYRKLLSDESKKGSKYKGGRFFGIKHSVESLWKMVTKRTGLVREHPVSKYVFNKLLGDKIRYSVGYHMVHPINLSNKDLGVLERYDLTKY
jgi:hypothetical protein